MSVPAVPTDLSDQRAVRTTSSSVTGMTIFVASEAVFFAAFFGVYATSYTNAKVWPPAGTTVPSLLLPTISVAVLLASGVTMARGMSRAHHVDYPRGVLPWLSATLAGAVVFAILVGIGLGDVDFTAAAGIYQSLFYVIVGLEMAHVVGGLVLLALVLVRAGNGELELRRDPVQCAGIYWYFVVALGVVVYLVLYLGVR
ncbi:MAG TPA: cytochrome c oxidase subunit 3 [Marmoricola sp.]|nr:cytochrome c oxidase subunit 3 [Marmoricola sp.]